MNRRDFLEKFIYTLTCAILALFGFRPELTHDEVKRQIRETAKRLALSTTNEFSSYAGILKEMYPQHDLYAIAYGSSRFWGRIAS